MELSQMEHKLNSMWAMLSNDMMIGNLVLIISKNPPPAASIELLKSSDASLIMMCVSYITAKYVYERAVSLQLQNDHDEPSYNKNEQ